MKKECECCKKLPATCRMIAPLVEGDEEYEYICMECYKEIFSKPRWSEGMPK